MVLWWVMGWCCGVMVGDVDDYSGGGGGGDGGGDEDDDYCSA